MALEYTHLFLWLLVPGFVGSVYYRKVMTHITQWDFLHHFCIRALENQRYLNYLVNIHRQYF